MRDSNKCNSFQKWGSKEITCICNNHTFRYTLMWVSQIKCLKPAYISYFTINTCIIYIF